MAPGSSLLEGADLAALLSGSGGYNHLGKPLCQLACACRALALAAHPFIEQQTVRIGVHRFYTDRYTAASVAHKSLAVVRSTGMTGSKGRVVVKAD